MARSRMHYYARNPLRSHPFIETDAGTDLGSWSWQSEAACRNTDPEEWFRNGEEPTSDLKEICTSCSVQPQCLASALEHDEYGYWGGVEETTRRKQLGRSATRR